MRKPEEITDEKRKKGMIWELGIVGVAMAGFGLQWGVRGLAVSLLGMMAAGAYIYSRYLRVKGTTAHGHGDAVFETRYELYDREFVMDPEIFFGDETLALNGLSSHGDETVNSLAIRSLQTSVPMPAVHNFLTVRGQRTAINEEHKRVVRGRISGERAEACRLGAQIYTDRISISLNGKWCQRNSNAIVFGGSGTGKSRYFLKPNVLQANSSYIITDPSGDLLQGLGFFLAQVAGYKVRCFNVSDMGHSCRFNPLHYIYEEADIPQLVNVFMENTQPQKGGGADANFWDKTTRALLCACIGYLFEVCPEEERNFSNVLELIRMDQRTEGDAEEETAFDVMFRLLGEADPTSYAYKQYLTYKEAPVKTALSIQISTTVLLSQFFDIEAFQNLTYKDELELEKLGEEKTALFLIIPQADTTYSWVTAILYTLLIKSLLKQGEERMRKEGLPDPEVAVPVRFLIDEAANIGKIPGLQHYLAISRKYRISIVPIFQNYSQVVAIYGKDAANDILSNCDAFLFLGGVDGETLKIVVERAGRETVQTMSDTVPIGTQGSASQGRAQTGRELISRIQAEQMANDTCLLFIRGLSPFKTKKYRLERHANFRFTAEAGAPLFLNPFLLEYSDEEMEGIRIKKATEAGYIAPRVKDSARRRALMVELTAELAVKQEELKRCREQLVIAEEAGDEMTVFRVQGKVAKLEERVEHLKGVVCL